MGGLGALRELRFQTWRTPRPPERRKKCTKRGFRGTMYACESFVRNTACPEGCFCDENIVNNKVIARGPLSPIWCKLAPKRLPKGGLGPHFGGPGPSRRPRQRENGGSEKLSEHLRKKTCFHGRAGSEMGVALSWGGSPPWVLATFSPWTTFSFKE